MQSPTAAAAKPPFAEPEQHLKCPQCDSTNTKFCYYNNYNLSQPRHFCKDCHRYWTKGGTLRNIPVGGGTRKNSKRSSASATSGATASKRPSTTSPPSPPSDQLPKPEPISVLYPPPADSDDRLLDITGSFSSLLASSGGFGNLLEGFGSGASSGAAGVLPNLGDLNRSMGGGVDQLRRRPPAAGVLRRQSHPPMVLSRQGGFCFARGEREGPVCGAGGRGEGQEAAWASRPDVAKT